MSVMICLPVGPPKHVKRKQKFLSRSPGHCRNTRWVYFQGSIGLGGNGIGVKSTIPIISLLTLQWTDYPDKCICLLKTCCYIDIFFSITRSMHLVLMMQNWVIFTCHSLKTMFWHKLHLMLIELWNLSSFYWKFVICASYPVSTELRSWH